MELKTRWDIINAFIRARSCHTYLEIGYYKGWNFDKIEAPLKVAIDPHPCKDAFQENAPSGSIIADTLASFVVKMSSNGYFSKKNEVDEEILSHILLGSHDSIEYDVIFIDGLHYAYQVDLDIHNGLKNLSKNGVILLHDCNPPTLEHVTEGAPNGEWNGDVYKSFINYRREGRYLAYTINEDWGIGVIDTSAKRRENNILNNDAFYHWEVFSRNRADLLGLIDSKDLESLMSISNIESEEEIKQE